jgi:hypothetical protein
VASPLVTSPSVRRCHQQLRFQAAYKQLDDVDFGLEVDEQTDGLSETACARQLVAGERVHSAVRREERRAIVVWAGNE